MKERIGNRIRELREARGWSPFELAMRTGIQEQNIRNWESGRRAPSTEMLPPLARALGVTLDDLFGMGDAACSGRA